MNIPQEQGRSQLPTAHIYEDATPRDMPKAELELISRNVGDFILGNVITDQDRLIEGWQRATHDQMSPDMLNREGAQEWFERHRPKKAAVFLLDAVGFKAINDTYGQYTGDETIKGVGSELLKRLRTGSSEEDSERHHERLSSANDRIGLRQGSAVARVGGDEWLAVVNLDDVAGEELDKVINLIKDRITKPAEFDIDGNRIKATLRSAVLSPDETKDKNLTEIYQNLSDRLVDVKAG